MLKSCSGVTYCHSSFNCLLPIGSKDQQSVHQFFDIDELEDECTHISVRLCRSLLDLCDTGVFCGD